MLKALHCGKCQILVFNHIVRWSSLTQMIIPYKIKQKIHVEQQIKPFVCSLLLKNNARLTKKPSLFLLFCFLCCIPFVGVFFFSSAAV